MGELSSFSMSEAFTGREEGEINVKNLNAKLKSLNFIYWVDIGVSIKDF